jgi:hypothetical protein
MLWQTTKFDDAYELEQAMLKHLDMMDNAKMTRFDF